MPAWARLGRKGRLGRARRDADDTRDYVGKRIGASDYSIVVHFDFVGEMEPLDSMLSGPAMEIMSIFELLPFPLLQLSI